MRICFPCTDQYEFNLPPQQGLPAHLLSSCISPSFPLCCPLLHPSVPSTAGTWISWSYVHQGSISALPEQILLVQGRVSLSASVTPLISDPFGLLLAPLAYSSRAVPHTELLFQLWGVTK